MKKRVQIDASQPFLSSQKSRNFTEPDKTSFKSPQHATSKANPRKNLSPLQTLTPLPRNAPGLHSPDPHQYKSHTPTPNATFILSPTLTKPKRPVLRSSMNHFSSEDRLAASREVSKYLHMTEESITEDETLKKSMMEESSVLMGDDEVPKEYVGENAVTKFYSHYKRLEKIKQTNVLKKIPDSSMTNFFKKTEELKALPTRIGMVRKRGDENAIDVR